MTQKIILFTSNEQEDKYYEGEVFYACINRSDKYSNKFAVSTKYVMDSIGELRFIDTGSDVDFITE